MHIFVKFRPFVGGKLVVVVDGIAHLGVRHIVLIAHGVHLDAGFGNTMFDEEMLCYFSSALGKTLIVFRGTAWISMGIQNELCVRVCGAVGKEVGRQGNQGVALAWE